MAYQSTQIGKEPRRAPNLEARACPAEPGLSRSRSRKVLEEHLNRILIQLTQPEAAVDTGRVQETLLELSAVIRFGTPVFQNSDYRWILARLTRIYAQGFVLRTQEPFITTAAAYAQVIETISREYPDHDYSEAIGQLFCYMTRLFRTQESSWKAVYDHILSIPDSVEAKQLLNRAFFVEIQEWAEAGVENLFSIRRDLNERIGELGTRIKGLDRRIARFGGKSQQSEQTNTQACRSNVIDLAQVRTERLIAVLKHKRQSLVEEKEREESIVDLIESDIREFEDKLRNTRRAYFFRSV